MLQVEHCNSLGSPACSWPTLCNIKQCLVPPLASRVKQMLLWRLLENKKSFLHASSISDAHYLCYFNLFNAQSVCLLDLLGMYTWKCHFMAYSCTQEMTGTPIWLKNSPLSQRTFKMWKTAKYSISYCQCFSKRSATKLSTLMIFWIIYFTQCMFFRSSLSNGFTSGTPLQAFDICFLLLNLSADINKGFSLCAHSIWCRSLITSTDSQLSITHLFRKSLFPHRHYLHGVLSIPLVLPKRAGRHEENNRFIATKTLEIALYLKWYSLCRCQTIFFIWTQAS